MNFITNSTENNCVKALSERMVGELGVGKKVLWLIPGGSNISISTGVINEVLRNVDKNILENLTIAQTDERYGPVGHKDSNWKQMKDEGFNFENVKSIPVLLDLPLQETVEIYGKEIEKEFERNDVIMGQFGIGTDGHIAGVLPHTIGVEATDDVIGYDSSPYIRISLSLLAIKRVNVAYAFALGGSKKEALDNLHKEISLEEEPAQILKHIAEANVYTD